ncbi:MAG: TetR/AcrR family transcriptional regulator [Deltaproteobacteria bacterium]|nr:TetR/AcrR family transcriptional regulator [Deltaproteobacteria bacterium]
MDTLLVQPKQTFVNLSPEKRESILRAAVSEFAEHGYQRASLNNIVKRLGISKGSLYQYFDNKEALFLHVFDHFTQQVKHYVKASVAGNGRDDFFVVARQVLLAGIAFIDGHPEYFQVYLKVLFERDVPRREELVARVRLFSLEYFGPLADRAMGQGLLRSDIPAHKVVFILDAMLDRFLQGYAQPYLDGGLALAGMTAGRLDDEIDSMVAVLRTGLQPSGNGE